MNALDVHSLATLYLCDQQLSNKFANAGRVPEFIQKSLSRNLSGFNRLSRCSSLKNSFKNPTAGRNASLGFRRSKGNRPFQISRPRIDPFIADSTTLDRLWPDSIRGLLYSQHDLLRVFFMTDARGRAQLKHVLLDVGLKDKPKMIDLEDAFGPIARLLFLDLTAAMSAATDAKITRGAARVLARRIGIDTPTAEAIVQHCIDSGMLEVEDGHLTNSRVIQDQESYFESLQGKRADADRKRKEVPRKLHGSSVEPPPEFQRKSTGENTEIRRNPDNDYDYDTDPKYKEECPTDPIEPAPETDLEKWAEEQLQPATTPAISSSPAYMTMGRRPMKKYPRILLTRRDLVEIRELYESSQIPVTEFKRPFRKVDAHIEKQVAQGGESWRASHKSWLIGWAYTDTMKELKAQNDMQRSDGYLRGQA